MIGELRGGDVWTDEVHPTVWLFGLLFLWLLWPENQLSSTVGGRNFADDRTESVDRCRVAVEGPILGAGGRVPSVNVRIDGGRPNAIADQA